MCVIGRTDKRDQVQIYTTSEKFCELGLKDKVEVTATVKSYKLVKEVKTTVLGGRIKIALVTNPFHEKGFNLLKNKVFFMSIVQRSFHSDSGHGWLAVPKKEIVELGLAEKISGFSYVKGGTVYLEEDRDMGLYIDAMKSKGNDVVLKFLDSKIRSPIRNYCSYSPV